MQEAAIAKAVCSCVAMWKAIGYVRSGESVYERNSTRRASCAPITLQSTSAYLKQRTPGVTHANLAVNPDITMNFLLISICSCLMTIAGKAMNDKSVTISIAPMMYQNTFCVYVNSLTYSSMRGSYNIKALLINICPRSRKLALESYSKDCCNRPS